MSRVLDKGLRTADNDERRLHLPVGCTAMGDAILAEL